MSLRNSFLRVFTALNNADVRYLLVGGLAVAAHGHARATGDIDVAIALDRENTLRAVHALSELGYSPTAPVRATDFADAVVREGWVQDKGMVAFQMRTGNPLDMPIDLLATEQFPFAEAFRRAPRKEFGPGLVIPLVPLETLLEMKRAAGRPQDLADIAALRLLHPKGPGVESIEP